MFVGSKAAWYEIVDHLPAHMQEHDKASIMGGNLSRIMRVPAPA